MILRAILLVALAAAGATAIVLGAASARGVDDQRAHERSEALADERAARLAQALDEREGRAIAMASFLCQRLAEGEPVDAQRGLGGALGMDVVRVARPSQPGGASVAQLVFTEEGPALVARCAVETPDGAREVLAGWDTARLSLDRQAPTAFAPVGGAPGDLPPGASLRRVRRIEGWQTEPRELVTWALRVAPVRDRSLEWIALSAIALLTIAGLFAMRRRSDGQLEAAVARIGRGDLDVTLDGHGATVSAFNRMTRELRDARTRLARAERIAAWRDIARRIAHEIKNPLTPIKMAMETARKTHARKHPDFDEIFDESTRTVLEEVNRLEHIVTEFSRFARLPRPNPESLNVREVVEKVVAMHDLDPAHATLPEAAKGVRVELALGQSKFPEVRADKEQLTQVLVNLVQNACDAAREKHGETGGRVVVALDAIENAGVRVTISDNGPGIPKEERGRVLEPYYTTKAHGTGLGMAIVDRIVSDHGGSLGIEDAALGGAAIVVTLRREGPPEEAEATVG